MPGMQLTGRGSFPYRLFVTWPWLSLGRMLPRQRSGAISNRIHTLHIGEADEIGIVAVDHESVVSGEGGDVGIGGQITAGVGSAKHGLQVVPMGVGGANQLDVGLGEPPIDDRDRLIGL